MSGLWKSHVRAHMFLDIHFLIQNVRQKFFFTFSEFAVVIRYFRGHIDDLVTEEDDPFWSIDIKMGVLSFFEVNFNERQSLQSLDNPVTVEHTDLLPKFYRVVEVCNGSVHRSYMSDFTIRVKDRR